MHQLGVLRRNRRTKLKKSHCKRDMTKEQVLAKIPPKLDLVQWAELVNYWFDQKTVTLSDKNKVSRGFQKEIATCGAKSFAQISDDMAKANGAPVERADLYLKVYRRKDGVGVTPRAEENIRRIEGLLSEEGVRLQGEPGSTSGILWSKDDAYARVFGPERPGRVRGVGFGITPSGRSVTNASKFTSTPSPSTRTSQRILELEHDNALIREQLAQVQEQLSQSDARHQEQQQQTEVRHQQQLDAALARMNAMFAQLSSGTPFFDPSQGGNA